MDAMKPGSTDQQAAPVEEPAIKPDDASLVLALNSERIRRYAATHKVGEPPVVSVEEPYNYDIQPVKARTYPVHGKWSPKWSYSCIRGRP
jgi:hypothetical protein